ncbi:MAG: hypothetical protein JWO43_268 [Candidatus Adlerbacteria bacterium]|nr:hypothetical protein [Candidatus Adlerbacteria bacterium]
MEHISRIFILFSGRFPSEKAAALFVSLSAHAFADHAPVCVVVPRRFGAAKGGVDYFDIAPHVQVVYLPTFDLFYVPILRRIAFPVHTLVFSLMCFVYLLWKRRAGCVAFANELGPALVSSCVIPTVFEAHDFPERSLFLYRIMFKRLRAILATNIWKEGALANRFPELAGKIVMERNGVDVEKFSTFRSIKECRSKLGLDPDAQVVVYTGHLYGWKGIDTALAAAARMPQVQYLFVGGSAEELTNMNKYGTASNVRFVGQVPHDQVPLWQGAADVLLLPNTAQEDISAQYTSPMKLFEYMASARPIVASDIPSVREIIDEECAFMYEPDDAQDLVRAVTQVLDEPNEAGRRGLIARKRAEYHSWTRRAARLLKRI